MEWESEGHPWRQCHREGTCEFDLLTLGTQPGRQTLLPIACTSGSDHQEHRLRVEKRRATSQMSSKSTVQTLPMCLPGPRPPHHPTAPTRCMRWLTVTVLPGLSGWRVPTRRHQPVMRGSCPPSSFAINRPDGRWQDRPRRARPADRSLVAEDRSAGGVRDQTGPEPRSVRAGSAAEGRTVDNSGQERTPNLHRNRRSSHLQPPDLGRRRQAKWSSSLSSRRRSDTAIFDRNGRADHVGMPLRTVLSLGCSNQMRSPSDRRR
jgi:hypothetical protein